MERWLNRFSVADTNELDMPYVAYIGMIRRLLEPVIVDTEWYLTTYPKVSDSITRGNFKSADQHFLLHGYFENRLPFAADRTDRALPVPFDEIRAATPVRAARGGLRVRMPRADLMAIVRRLLRSVPVDETWYRDTYPAVGNDLGRNEFSSATAHFVETGYNENYWPFPMRVDERWYLRRYPDVPRAIAEGHATSAQDHFWRTGYREGRFPAASPELV